VNVQVEQLSSCKRKLTIDIESSAVNEKRQNLVKEIQRLATVPGFRRGKAPLPIFLRQYQSVIDRELKNELLKDTLKEALDQQAIIPLNQEKVSEVVFDAAGNAQYYFVFEHDPQFELASYQGHTIEMLRVNRDVEQIMEQEIENLRKKAGKFAETEIVSNQSIIFYQVVFFSDSGEELTTHKDQFLNMIYLKDDQKELAALLLGKKTNDCIETQLVEIGRENDDQPPKIPAKITIQSIRELTLPELSDEWVQEITHKQVNTVEEYKLKLKEAVESHIENDIKQSRRLAIDRYLVTANLFDVPESLLKHYYSVQVNKVRDEYAQNTKQLDQALSDEQLQSILFKTFFDLKSYYVFKKIAETEKIDVTTDEVTEKIRQIAEEHGLDAKEFKRDLIKSEGLNDFKWDMVKDKLYEKLMKENELVEVETYSKPSEEQTSMVELPPVESELDRGGE